MAVATVLLASLGIAAAQTSPPCQIVSVEVSPKEVDAGALVVFSAKLNQLVPTAKPEFKWQLNVGTIIGGEGTSSITVDTAGLDGQSVEATVSVSGISTTCSTSATQLVAIPVAGPACGMPFDEYGNISFEDEKAVLDNFAIQLTNFKPAATGYILIYAGQKTYEGEAAERLQRAKNYLVKVRHVDPARITTVDGGYRPDFSVTLIIIPPGTEPPGAAPTLTHDDVEFTKPHPRNPLRRKSSKRG